MSPVERFISQLCCLLGLHSWDDIYIAAGPLRICRECNRQEIA